ncbi:hypothetical protein BCO18175_02790 [Burkholderia contaminans]|uniref:hypothetical protein n=1 Tax=Burkholderia contaminans TaxID=488447 RepID=UPI001453142B|nr:hypothetical protein [Burkholderia contaminans]VWC82316.1 hypothetical protein BCO18175_02790 [Burkholderia contaminans]
MSDHPSYIRLPLSLSDSALVVVPPSLDDDEFAAHQVEFIKCVFSYSAYLRERERETPVSDSFLIAFVSLFEAIDANAPEDARRCALQLQQILRMLVTGPDGISPEPSIPPTF